MDGQPGLGQYLPPSGLRSVRRSVESLRDPVHRGASRPPLCEHSVPVRRRERSGPYPFGSDTPIEGGQDSTGDRHAIMVDPSTCTLHELYDAHYDPSGSTAGSGAIWNLRSDALRPAGWTSADAAGLPILPGLVNYDQASSGSMDHATRFTAQCTQNAYIWPARHEAGQPDSACPPMGARFRLSASFSLPASECASICQTLVTTLKEYGLILADNGSNWYFQGTADTRWTETDVDQLKQIPASQFEAVDESGLMVSPDSGQAFSPGAGTATPTTTAPTSTTPTTTTTTRTTVEHGAVSSTSLIPGSTTPTSSTVGTSDGPTVPKAGSRRAIPVARGTDTGPLSWLTVVAAAAGALGLGMVLRTTRKRHRLIKTGDDED